MSRDEEAAALLAKLVALHDGNELIAEIYADADADELSAAIAETEATIAEIAQKGRLAVLWDDAGLAPVPAPVAR